MEREKAKRIVEESLKLAPHNSWYYYKNHEGKYGKVRLFISKKGELCEYQKKSNDVYEEASTRDYVYLRPQFTSKSQLLFSNVSRMLGYLKESGLWEELVPELTMLSKETGETIGTLFDATKKEQSDYLKKRGFVHISLRHFRNMMYDRKFIRPVYYGKENFRIKQKVQNSLSKGNKFLIKWRKTYDNTISYNPEEMKAWYSEEYRGQSSGHYYILLDDTHATFKVER